MTRSSVSRTSACSLGLVAFPFGAIEGADFDLDGDIDIVGSGLNAFSIALNNGAGVFASTFAMIMTSASDLAAGDFTGDGKPDLIALNFTNLPLFSLYVNSTP